VKSLCLLRRDPHVIDNSIRFSKAHVCKTGITIGGTLIRLASPAG
jgi:hypothetical protein